MPRCAMFALLRLAAVRADFPITLQGIFVSFLRVPLPGRVGTGTASLARRDGFRYRQARGTRSSWLVRGSLPLSGPE